MIRMKYDSDSSLTIPDFIVIILNKNKAFIDSHHF